MIDKLTYDEILNISKGLEEQAKKIAELSKDKNIPQLDDFVSTVEGYSKFLENTVEINKDADNALKDLVDQIK